LGEAHDEFHVRGKLLRLARPKTPNPTGSTEPFVAFDVIPPPSKDGPPLPWIGPSTMKPFFFVLSLLSVCYAQSGLDVSSGVGGPNPPITFPFVNGFNSLSGKYQHVVILSIDGFHTVYHSSAKIT
jgi:hypothetical protein